MESFAARAPAKLNLWLAVHGRRDDGYHELSTVLATLDLADELRLAPRAEPGIELRLTGPAAAADVPADASNLAGRAASAVLEVARGSGGGGEPWGLRLELDKRVPSQAGLGGGSSDAATALRLAERACGIDLGAERRRAILAGLGADCVFFHEAGPSGLALAEGFGERVRPIPGQPPGWTVALVVPELRAPTGAVFEALGLAGARTRREPPDLQRLARASAEEARALLHNDLEAAALAALPGLAAWRGLLDDCGADHFRLSGSGSSFYGLFDEEGGAAEALASVVLAARNKEFGTRLAGLQRMASGTSAG